MRRIIRLTTIWRSCCNGCVVYRPRNHRQPASQRQLHALRGRRPLQLGSTEENTEVSSPDAVEKLLKLAEFEPRSAAPEKNAQPGGHARNRKSKRSVCNCLASSSQWIKSSLDNGVRRWVLLGAGNSIAMPNAGICFDDHLVWFGRVGCGDIFPSAIEIAATKFKVVEAHKQLQLDEIAREQHLKPHAGRAGTGAKRAG